MFKKIFMILGMMSVLSSTTLIMAQEEEKSDGNNKWLFFSLGLEGTYLKSTTEEFSYSPSLEVKIKKIENLDISIEGSYLGNKLIYNGLGQSEVIKMGEVLGKASYSFDNGFDFGIEGSMRFGNLNYNGMGGALNIGIPLKESLKFEASLSYDQNKYDFLTLKIKETTTDLDLDVDYSITDDLSWIIGGIYTATEYSPAASLYKVYSVYTKIFYIVNEKFNFNIGVKAGQDSSKYLILTGMGGFNLSIMDNLSFGAFINYSQYSSSSGTKGKKTPVGSSSSFSDYSITGEITLTF